MISIQQYRPYYKQTFRLALPVIISQLGQHTVQLVDTLMVGRLGSTEIAAVSLANSVAWPVLLLGMGMAMGLTPLVGKASARGDFNRLTSLLKNSLLLNIVFGIGITLLLMVGYMFLDNLGQDPKIIPTAKNFYLWMVATAMPIMLYSTGRQFLEGLGNTTYAMIIVIISNVLNILLNFALIYGLWIFPRMGAEGAGASTFIARTAQVLMFAILFIRKEQYRRFFANFKNVAYSTLRLRRLMNIGFPISIQIFTEMVVFSLMAIAVGNFGAKELAAHQIAINIPSTTFMVILGLQAATTIRVSRAFGLRDYESMRMSMNASAHLVMAVMITSAILISISAKPIASLFTTEQDVIDMAVKFLFFGALFQIPDGIQGVYLGGLRGMTIVKKPMYYAIITYLLIGLPVGYMCSLTFGMGAYGTWVGFITALTIFAVLYYRLFTKQLNKLKTNNIRNGIN